MIIFLLSRIIAFIKSPKKKKDDSLSYLTASEISAEDKVKDLDYLASIVKNSYIKYDFVDIEKEKSLKKSSHTTKITHKTLMIFNSEQP